MSARGAVVALALTLVLAGCGGGAGRSTGTGREALRPPNASGTFSPYVDVTLSPPFDLAGVVPDAGARSLTLAFVTAGAGACRAAWGGSTAIDAPAVAGPAARVREAGVAVRVSFGGAQGAELAARCPTVGQLEAAYAGVVDRYRAAAVDFDLEGTALADHAGMVRRARALARLQPAARPPAGVSPGAGVPAAGSVHLAAGAQDPRATGRTLGVSLTLPVSPTGLSPLALAAVRTMTDAGVRLTTVNLLAMDYGSPVASGHMGADAIAALESAHRQLARLGGGLAAWSALGVTAMAGVNDTPGEVFTLKDARRLADFAGKRGLGLLSLWSLARDNPCAGGPRRAADPTCSGVEEPPYAFSQAFGGHPKPGVLPRRALDAG